MNESQSFKDMKVIKTILDLHSDKLTEQNNMILFGASLEVLRDLREKTNKIYQRLDDFDVKIDNLAPNTVEEMEKTKEKIEINSEFVTKFLNEIQNLDDDKKKLLKGALLDAKEKKETTETPVKDEVEKTFMSLGDKRKAMITKMIEKYDKVNPTQLSKLIGLSRTRCNEYLKEMEGESTVESFRDGRKVFYKLV